MGVEQIKRVVVLMLENRSFDHMLGALPGIDGASAANVNRGSNGDVYSQALNDNFKSPNKLDPRHEFANVQKQLGPGAAPRPMSGFVQDAQDTAARLSGFGDLPASEQRRTIQSVMDCFSDGALPGLQALAREFAVCERWFASVPGPTWPNRFFAMMGSCHGQLEMPSGLSSALVAVRAIADQIGKETIFSVLGAGQSGVYSDYLVPLSILLKGSGSRSSINTFCDHVDAGTLPSFTWIEPNFSSNLAHATSQHPPEDVRRGDNFIVEVYNKLRGNPTIWNETLLVVLYDEHGGFYDHVAPVATVKADSHPSHPAFDYDITGCRVPCVLVSPWIKRSVVSQDYDHTSLLAFVCDQFGKSDQRASLGQRVQATDHFGAAPIWCDVARDDTPAQLAKSDIPASLDQEEASADLDDLQSKLLMGLDAYARTHSAFSSPLLLRSHILGATGVADRASPVGIAADARIAQAWAQTGEVDAAQVEAMLAHVKGAFAP